MGKGVEQREREVSEALGAHGWKEESEGGEEKEGERRREKQEGGSGKA